MFLKTVLKLLQSLSCLASCFENWMFSLTPDVQLNLPLLPYFSLVPKLDQNCSLLPDGGVTSTLEPHTLQSIIISSSIIIII